VNAASQAPEHLYGIGRVDWLSQHGPAIHDRCVRRDY
jgi:hypothetical protein